MAQQEAERDEIDVEVGLLHYICPNYEIAMGIAWQISARRLRGPAASCTRGRAKRVCDPKKSRNKMKSKSKTMPLLSSRES
jgi:hypothetical protein